MPSAKILEQKKAAVAELAEKMGRAASGVLVKYQGTFAEAADEIFETKTDSPEAVIVTYGKVSHVAVEAARLSDRSVKVIRLAKICPVDMSALTDSIGDAKLVYILEEGVKRGGIGEMIASYVAEAGLGKTVYCHNAPDGFVCHGDTDSLYRH